MKVILSHPTGNQFVRALISAMSAANFLSEFHTTIAINPNRFWLNLLPANVKHELLRRSFPIPHTQIVTHPVLELSRLLLPKMGVYRPLKHETGWASVDAIYKNIDKHVASRLYHLNQNNKADAIYAYEDGAELSFKIGKQLNMQCLYDLPIGYWRAAQEMLKVELERWPDWAVTLTGLQDSLSKKERKDEELRLADKIFVASKFTASTLTYFKGKLAPVKIIPYGFPPVTGIRTYTINLSEQRPLKLLFVGGLSQRKGIANLFAAVSIFGRRVELTVVGNKPVQNCMALNQELKKHRWIPGLPHSSILDLMRQNDVLIFPSLFEGFGMVITEAMAQGTPVITTERTAGPDVIKNEANGWLVKAGDTEQLINAIEKIMVNPRLIESTGKAAMETARARTWDLYGQELLNALTNND